LKKEAIHKSFKATFTIKNLKGIYGTSVVTVFGAFFVLHSLFKWTKIDSAVTVIGLGLIILFIIFVYYLVVFSNEIAKRTELEEKEEKERQHKIELEKVAKSNLEYGEVIIGLKELFIRINGLKKLRPNIDKPNFKGTLQYVCDKVKDIFEKKTGAKCGVSIKIFVTDKFAEAPNIKSTVTNLITDKAIAASEIRNGVEYKKIKHHPIIKNTAYKKIFDNYYADKKEDLFHIHNTMPIDCDYQSTSFQARGGDHRKPTMSEEELRTAWVLSYRAEIVVPIFSSPIDDETFTWFGFLCVDADKEGVFHHKYDVQALIGISEGLFDLFDCHYQIEEPSKRFFPVAYQATQKEIKNPISRKIQRKKRTKK
jgi:Na+-transporting methylmalonyl-CoA/oxaloacetate decarboxylase gamma subunit